MTEAYNPYEVAPAHGLNGSNPLGFLAAIGLLRILDQWAQSAGRIRPRLTWHDDGTWYPIIHRAGSIDRIINAVIGDRTSWDDDSAFLLAYDSSGTMLVDPRSDRSNAVRDLKPQPSAMRTFLSQIAATAESGTSYMNRWLACRRTMDTASAYGSEVIQDNNGNTKPFALHFTAGQQKFLDGIAKIRAGVTAEDIRDALLGPWRGSSILPNMSWDASVARIYALRAGDPSTEKRGGNPGADWLAFNAIPLLLATPVRGRLVTTGVRGGWKDGAFTWPLWEPPASIQVVRSLLAIHDLHRMTQTHNLFRGISVVFSSDISRSEQGGYGAFSPARVVLSPSPTA